MDGSRLTLTWNSTNVLTESPLFLYTCKCIGGLSGETDSCLDVISGSWSLAERNSWTPRDAGVSKVEEKRSIGQPPGLVGVPNTGISGSRWGASGNGWTGPYFHGAGGGGIPCDQNDWCSKLGGGAQQVVYPNTGTWDVNYEDGAADEVWLCIQGYGKYQKFTSDTEELLPTFRYTYLSSGDPLFRGFSEYGNASSLGGFRVVPTPPDPTQLPTTLPSEKPTPLPTFVPTLLPSEVPTMRPTPAPSAKPSPLPTVRPSSSPTPQPSPTPTSSDKVGVAVNLQLTVVQLSDITEAIVQATFAGRLGGAPVSSMKGITVAAGVRRRLELGEPDRSGLASERRLTVAVDVSFEVGGSLSVLGFSTATEFQVRRLQPTKLAPGSPVQSQPASPLS